MEDFNACRRETAYGRLGGCPDVIGAAPLLTGFPLMGFSSGVTADVAR